MKKVKCSKKNNEEVETFVVREILRKVEIRFCNSWNLLEMVVAKKVQVEEIKLIRSLYKTHHSPCRSLVGMPRTAKSPPKKDNWLNSFPCSL